jgi:pyruvate dehydrogenase E2 component (dihydrolipoamide acetyltransferase)
LIIFALKTLKNINKETLVNTSYNIYVCIKIIEIMASVVIMPRQGQSVESCILSDIHKKKGDPVVQGEILFSYETDKASFEEVSPADGIVLELFFEAGDEVPVLENVMIIGQPGESTSEFHSATAAQATTPHVSEPEKTPAPVAMTNDLIVPTHDMKKTDGAGISPRARNSAQKAGIDLQSLVGTGPKGRIIESDVLAAARQQPKTTPLAKQIVQAGNVEAGQSGTGLGGSVTSKDLVSTNPIYATDFEVKPLTNIRKLIAKAMHASLQNSAQLTHHLGADARRLTELRKKVKKAMDTGYPTNITLNDMVCFAVIKALKKFPQVNAHFMGDSLKIFNKVHLGLAVDTERGLMVPAIKNADDLSIQGLSNHLKEVANSCKKGNVNPELLASEAATFTVSNLGNYGVEMFTPVINLPQVAILGVNAIVLRPKEMGDGIFGFVPYMGLSLTYDHRALDGGEATRFLKQIAIEIETLDFEL